MEKTYINIGVSSLFIAFILFVLAVGNQNDKEYQNRLNNFTEQCFQKHRVVKWKRLTGYYCAEPNSVDFFE